jgi:hypothetical protein
MSYIWFWLSKPIADLIFIAIVVGIVFGIGAWKGRKWSK